MSVTLHFEVFEVSEIVIEYKLFFTLKKSYSIKTNTTITCFAWTAVF